MKTSLPSKKIDLIWLVQETKKITMGLDIKLNNPAVLYHFIISFINLRQVQYELNNNLKLHWDNVYDTMDLSGGYNILRRDQLIKLAWDQELSKKKQVKFYEMMAMCFLLVSEQNMYSFLLK